MAGVLHVMDNMGFEPKHKGPKAMPKYSCHEEVWAFKIRTIEGPLPSGDWLLHPEDKKCSPVLVSVEYMRKHRPLAGGYYVKYKDGYESFKPAEAFEEGYSLIP